MAEEETTETSEETEETATTETEPEKAEEAASESEETTEDEEPKGKEKPKTAEQLRRELRTSDRVRKREAAKKDKELSDLRKQLKDREEADQTEQEKALAAAKEEGRTVAMTEARAERRSDRLDLAVTRLSAKGVKLEVDKDGETIAETVKFADKGALAMLRQAIADGTLEESTIFDDKDKVRDDGLQEALAEILGDEDWLIVRPASNDGEKPKPRAKESDAGKGSAGKGIEDMTTAEHVERMAKTGQT